MRSLVVAASLVVSSAASASPEFQFPTEREIAIGGCGVHADMSYMMVSFRVEGKTKEEIRAWAGRGIESGQNAERQTAILNQWTDELFDHPEDELLEFPVIRMANCLERDPRIGIPYAAGYRCYSIHMRPVSERTFGPNRALPLPPGLGPAAREGFSRCLELAAEGRQ